MATKKEKFITLIIALCIIIPIVIYMNPQNIFLVWFFCVAFPYSVGYIIRESWNYDTWIGGIMQNGLHKYRNKAPKPTTFFSNHLRSELKELSKGSIPYDRKKLIEFTQRVNNGDIPLSEVDIGLSKNSCYYHPKRS